MKFSLVFVLLAAITTTGCEPQPVVAEVPGVTSAPVVAEVTPAPAVPAGYSDYVTGTIASIDPPIPGTASVSPANWSQTIPAVIVTFTDGRAIEIFPAYSCAALNGITLPYPGQTPALIAKRFKVGDQVSYPSTFAYAGYGGNNVPLPLINKNGMGQIPAEAIAIPR